MMLLLALAAATAPIPAGLTAFVHDQRLTRYRSALTDLNGDGRPEALVYAIASADGDGAADLCGSGGCDLYVLALTPSGYRVISDISITRPPVRVLPSRSRGWQDLSVYVAGGGILPGHDVRLRFDGNSYPTNPTTPPALPLKASARGRVVIDRE